MLRSDADQIVVELETPPHTVADRWIDAQAFQTIEAPGLGSTGEPGRPDLPSGAVLLGIPPRGEPKLRVTVEDSTVYDQAVRIAPAPSPNPDAADAWAEHDRRPVDPAPGLVPLTIVRADPQSYRNPNLYPAEVAVITDVGWIRNQRVARIEMHPFQYSAAGRRLTVHGRVRVALTFDPTAQPALAAGDRAPAGEAGGPIPADSGSAAVAVDSDSTSIPADNGLATIPADTAFDDVLARALLNPGPARSWRADRILEILPPPEPPPAPADGGPVWNIAVDGTGMVRVAGADLALAGLPIDAIDPRRLQLHAGGDPVAMWVDGEDDGLFNASDAIVFYGRPTASRYAAANVYQLAYGSAPGLRMGRRNGAPGGAEVAEAFTATLRLEQDALYRSDYPRPAPGEPLVQGLDRWYWQQLSAPQALSHTAKPADVAPGDWAGRIGVTLVGKSSFTAVAPDHLVRVHVGGQRVGEAAWDGNTGMVRFEFPVPAALLRRGSVEVQIEAPQAPGVEYDHFFVDAIEIAYRRGFAADASRLAFGTDGAPGQEARDIRVEGLAGDDVAVFDVEVPDRPIRVEGAVVTGAADRRGAQFGDAGGGRRSYEVVTRAGYRAALRIDARPAAGLFAPARGADYVLIAPAAFKAALQPLVDRRAREGRRVALVDLQGIYDVWGGGVASAEAIRAFIAHAYRAWPAPPPSHVVLVGDGTYDPRNRLGNSPATILPPFLKVVDPWLGEVAVENAYATVSGDDVFPDLFLGRLPANSVADVTAMVGKITAYSSATKVEPWQSKLLFATDNPDSAGDFYAFSDDIAEHHVPAPYAVERVYLGRTHPDADDAKAALIAGFNSGYLLTQYIGHGLITGWTQEAMFGGNDVRGLRNGARLPVMLDMTCMTGYFGDPRLHSIAESAVRAAGGGAIAAFAPTGFGVATGHDYINRAFVDQLLSEGVRQIGPVAVGSKLHLGASTAGYRDLLETFALFGDPALEVRVPFVAPPTPTATPNSTETVPPTPTSTEIVPPPPTTTETAPPTATPQATVFVQPTDTPAATDPPQPTPTGAQTPKTTPPSRIETATPSPTAGPTETVTAIPTQPATAIPTETATTSPTETATAIPTEVLPTRAASPSPTRTTQASPGATKTPTPVPTVRSRIVKKYLPVALTFRKRRR